MQRKHILKRFKRIFQRWTNNYTKPQIKPLRRKEKHVRRNPLSCVVFYKSFRHTKQTKAADTIHTNENTENSFSVFFLYFRFR